MLWTRAARSREGGSRSHSDTVRNRAPFWSGRHAACGDDGAAHFVLDETRLAPIAGQPGVFRLWRTGLL